MFAFAGVAHTVYHPAAYAILFHGVFGERMAAAFSFHTFIGLLRSAAALMIPAAETFTPAILAPKPKKTQTDAEPSWRILLSGPIICNLVFFATASIANAGVQNYSVVALGVLRDTSPALANVGLTAYLSLAALGVLLGGVVAGRTHRHDAVAVIGFLIMSIGTVAIGAVDLGALALIFVMASTGLFYGIVMPSRDMIVRAVTPPGSFGKVFGFVTTGFNIGGMISPLIYGWLMDSGNPSAVFVLSAACGVVTILAIVIGSLWSTRAA